VLGSVLWAATCARQYRLRCYGPGPLGPRAPLKGAEERRGPLGQGGSVGRGQPSPQPRAQGMERLEEVDVSRLSVAECLALAEKQDTDREDAAAQDPVEGILERLAISATQLTQTIKDSSLDLGLATHDGDAAPFQELSRHLSTVSLLSFHAVKAEILVGLNRGLVDMDEETMKSWAAWRRTQQWRNR